MNYLRRIQTREIHLDKTGAQICFGYSAAIVDREMSQTFNPATGHPRGDAHDDLFAGILVARILRAKIKTP